MYFECRENSRANIATVLPLADPNFTIYNASGRTSIEKTMKKTQHQQTTLGTHERYYVLEDYLFFLSLSLADDEGGQLTLF